ncbi:MAG: caspase family protein [Bacteroidota bacterium]
MRQPLRANKRLFEKVPCRISVRGILFFLIILPLLGVSQHRGSWTPERYHGIPENDKFAVFFDEFEDNRNRWILESNSLKMKIRDGEFVCESPKPLTYLKRRTIPMNHHGNYEVEIRIRFESTSSNSLTGLTFGRDLKGNEYNFYFTPSGRYRISRYYEGKALNIQNWSYSKELIGHAYNTLTVRKVSSNWFFFINQKLVAKTQSDELFGNDYGFTIGGNTVIEVDYLKLNEVRVADTYGPSIAMISPIPDNDMNVVFRRAKETIQCRVSDFSGVSEVTINNKPVRVSPEGMVEAYIGPLAPGTYPITITAKDDFGNLTHKKLNITYYKPAVSQYSQEYTQDHLTAKTYETADDMPTRFGSYQSASRTRKGKNYLLLIGVNRYMHWSRLHNAVKDCGDLSDVLTGKYQFDKNLVFTLYNEKATREAILETLETLQDRITEDDNLLIYYAGHGFYDSQANLGYWVPVDARLNKIADFIRNSTIHDYLKTINSRHTFLIADACYAGSLFAHTRGGIVEEDSRSRWAFTSGDIEKVWDGQPGQNSPFARYLIKYLEKNMRSKLRADVLIKEVSNTVRRNTAQDPQGSFLRNVGHENGVFVFKRKY